MTSSMLVRIALLNERKRINSSLKKSMASNFHRAFRRGLDRMLARRWAAAADSGHSGSYQFRAASQPDDRRSILRSRSQFTRTSLVTSSPGTTTTSAAQNGGKASQKFPYFIKIQETINTPGPVSSDKT